MGGEGLRDHLVSLYAPQVQQLSRRYGVDPTLWRNFSSEVDSTVRADAPPLSPFGLKLVGPVIYTFGSDAQKKAFLPGILSGETFWCQGFSEPEAGSDLASLRTRAVEHDDHFVLSGQKTWVSWGQYARWCGVLARTEESGPRHRGISMLIVDMRSPGVQLRPMTQITGHAEFCELFLDDVVVPKENLLCARGDGWKIANALWTRASGKKES